MKIKNQKNEKTISFGELNPGEVFLFEGKPFLKTHIMGDCSRFEVNAISLVFYTGTNFGSGIMVIAKPNATLSLEGD